MAPGGVNVPISSTWNSAGVTKAKADIGTFERSTNGAISKVSKSWKGFVAGGLGALGATAIVSQLKDMASAAAEDQASVTKLGVALDNVHAGASKSGVEAFVEHMMLATGVADDKLRPALQTIVSATEDVGLSQKALTVAMDASVGTGKDLSTVSAAIAKGYGGQTTALARLLPGLDKNILKTGDMDAILAELTAKYSGQAAAAAETYTGKLQRVTTAADEASESIGYGLLSALDDVANSLGGTDGVVSLITDAGDNLGDFTRGLGESVGGITEWAKAINTAGNATDESGVSLFDLGTAAWEAFPGVKAVSDAYGWIADKGHDANQAEQELNDEINKSITLRHMYALALDDEAAATGRLNTELEKNKNALDHMSARSSVEAAIDAFGGLDSQGSKTWKDKHGKTHTSTFTKQFQTDWNSKRDSFNLGTEAGRQGWDAAKALIDATIAEAGMEGPKKAAATYQYGRKSLVEQLSGIGVPKSEARAFARQNLSTPSEITRQVNNNQKTTVNIDARGRSQAEINTLVNRVYRLAMIGTAPHGAAAAFDGGTPYGGRTGPVAADRGLGAAS